MICPNCKYEDGWNPNKREYIEGDHGEFFKLPLAMTRNNESIFGKNEKDVIGCPVCGTVCLDI